MQVISDPKYDTDVVNLRYLSKVISNLEKESETKISNLNKNYGSQPIPPYLKGDTYTVGNKIYKCINGRDIGSFDITDWQLIVDGEELKNFINNVYTLDKINITEQLDSKIETYIQEEDPSLAWTTNIEKEKHKGDYWRKKSGKIYREYCYTKYNTNPVSYGWAETDVPATVYDLIDGKKTIYTIKPISYCKDDMWIIEDTLEVTDLPPNTKIGDWVFAITNSDVYKKEDWVKKDEKVDIEYLEKNYYQSSIIDHTLTELERNTDSKITKAKNEINLSVSQSYTTKEETESVINQVSDVEKSIGTLTETTTTYGESLSQLAVETGEIKSTVANTVQKQNDFELTLNNDYLTKDQINADVGTNTENINSLREQITQLQHTANELSITITNINQNGVSKVVTETGFIFDKNGLKISKDGEPMTAIFDNKGFLVKYYETDLLVAQGDKVVAENLTAKTYFTAGRHRTEKFTDEKGRLGTGIFWNGDDV